MGHRGGGDVRDDATRFEVPVHRHERIGDDVGDQQQTGPDPGGEGEIKKVADQEVTGKTGDRRVASLYQITGLDFGPISIWLDAAPCDDFAREHVDAAEALCSTGSQLRQPGPPRCRTGSR